MKPRNFTPLLVEMSDEYRRRAPRSAGINDRALRVLVDGGNHTLRLVEPFPPRIVAAHGAWIEDQDGHRLLDYWQGHYANILGHNPRTVTAVLAKAFDDSFGLQTGFTDELQVETAEILCRQTGAERVRFTTSGTLATMYSIMLARAHTGRKQVMKVGGGWHGAQPWALKGIGFHDENGTGFQHVESDGVPVSVTDRVIVSGFNDPGLLEEHFRRYGDTLACFIVEPFIGAGGFAAADGEYLRAARRLADQYGVVLIFDEVVSGFRFRAGSCAAFYGVQPDLATYGKIIGGGMPIAAVVGRAEILDLAGRARGRKVRFSGGTYSAHPASILAARTMMTYLAEHEGEIYPRLAEQGERTRRALTEAFAQEGVLTQCAGHGNSVVPGSSLFMLHFPYDEKASLARPEEWSNPSVCDLTLAHKVLDLALLLEDVFVIHSHGAVSAAHGEAELDFLVAACHRAARRIKPYL